MKSSHLRPALACLALVCATSTALATPANDPKAGSDSATVRVTASVNEVCKFTSAPTLAFPAIDPSQATNVGQTAALKYKCTKDANPQFVVGGNATGAFQGQLNHATQPTKTLGYSLAWDAVQPKGAGFGSGGELAFNLSGTIAAAQYQDATAGSYEGAVTVTIAP